MATTQDFEIYSGNDGTLTATILDEDGEPIDLTNSYIEWVVKPSVRSATVVVEKNTDDANIVKTDASAGEISIIMLADDTESMDGKYYHEATMINNDILTTILTGEFTILPSAFPIPPEVEEEDPLSIVGKGCILTRTANLSIPVGGSIMEWDTELSDPYGFHSNDVNPDRITIPEGYAGRYLINVYIPYENEAVANGQRVGTSITKNGTVVADHGQPLSPSYISGIPSCVVDLEVGDIIRVPVYHTDNDPLVILPWTFTPRISVICLRALG